MARTLLFVGAAAVGAWMLVNLIVTTDRELVDRDVERLVALARRGGEEAVEGILMALADDYRGTAPFTRDAIARNLRYYVGAGRLTSLETGNYDTLWVGDEIEVPLLAVYAELEGSRAPVLLLRVTYGERADGWRIVNVQRWRQ